MKTICIIREAIKIVAPEIKTTLISLLITLVATGIVIGSYCGMKYLMENYPPVGISIMALAALVVLYWLIYSAIRGVVVLYRRAKDNCKPIDL